MTEEFPRRACLDRLTPAEHAIYEAVNAVEDAGADVRLTDAVVLLQAARESVADFVDGIDRRRHAVLGEPEAPAAVAPGRPAYRVEVEHDGCSYCQRGREYTVVGPDGVAIGESFEDREQADDIAELMNLAFEAGRVATRES